MKSHLTIHCLLVLFLSGLSVTAQASAKPVEEFTGPFPSWANVKTEFGAVGDGKTDDTAAIQKALESVRSKDSPKKVLYFPAGTYRITDTVKLMRISHHEPLGMSITGEDPEKTIIKWDGPAGGSMILYDAWYASISRLTLDGAGRAKSRDRSRKAGIHLYDVQNEGRLLVRDIWYEGDTWSLMNLTGSGEFAYHAGFVAPADPNHLDSTLDWEKDLRHSVAALQFDGFKGKLAFTLVSVNGVTLGVTPPSTGTKLYLLGYVTNQKMDFGGAAVKGQVVAEHIKAFRKDKHPDYPNQSTGVDSVDGVGQATPEFIREMLTPLRTVKPQPLTPLADNVSDVRFYRVWANGKNGVRLQTAPGGTP